MDNVYSKLLFATNNFIIGDGQFVVNLDSFTMLEIANVIQFVKESFCFSSFVSKAEIFSIFKI